MSRPATPSTAPAPGTPGAAGEPGPSGPPATAPAGAVRTASESGAEAAPEATAETAAGATAAGPGTARIGPFARRRLHTLLFLEEIRDFAPVFLDTEVDATALVAHRTAARAAGRRFSVVSYLLVAAAGVLAEHPEANAAVRGGRRPAVAHFTEVTGKVTVDSTLDGTRLVLSTVVPEPHRAGLEGVQRHLDRVRDGDPATLPDFAGVRALHDLPVDRARRRFRTAARALELRPKVTGTFAVTSLGHRAVDGFHSVGGTTVTLGVGRIADRPVARDGRVVVAPVLRLSLAFDHRAIDGAEAADVLDEIRTALQEWPAYRTAHEAADHSGDDTAARARPEEAGRR
jgi:hypothetical protein